jgi:hypothetical protein
MDDRPVLFFGRHASAIRGGIFFVDMLPTSGHHSTPPQITHEPKIPMVAAFSLILSHPRWSQLSASTQYAHPTIRSKTTISLSQINISNIIPKIQNFYPA